MTQRKTITERFFEKVDKTPGHGPNGDCWLWTGAIGKGGYGNAWADGAVNAHRLSYELFIDSIPPNTMVCHTCDMRNCVNPDHFFLGNHSINAIDMVAKGRDNAKAKACHGESNGAAKLTEGDVFFIRDSTLAYKELARSFGVSRNAISMIRLGKTWKHLLEPHAAELIAPVEGASVRGAATGAAT